MGTSEPRESKKAGDRRSWLAGLGLAVPDAFLMLEFPLLGIVLLVAAIALVSMNGRPAAGIAGLVVGLGGAWLLLFGRVALACNGGADGTCEAPGIENAILFSAGVLVLGGVASVLLAFNCASPRARQAPRS